MSIRHLLSGFNTIECAYYLTRTSGDSLDFARLEVEKGLMKSAKVRHPVDRILPSNIEAFSKATGLKPANDGFAKRYVQGLVDGIVVSGDTAIMKRSDAAPGNTVAEMKKGTSEEVPTFMHYWCARLDSNQ